MKSLCNAAVSKTYTMAKKFFFPFSSPSSSSSAVAVATFTHAERERGREWVRVEGRKKKEKKIYFQHFQHNKINDLLLYHHIVLRNFTQQVGAVLLLFGYIYVYDFRWVGMFVVVVLWHCSPIRFTKIVQHRIVRLIINRKLPK